MLAEKANLGRKDKIPKEFDVAILLINIAIKIEKWIISNYSNSGKIDSVKNDLVQHMLKMIGRLFFTVSYLGKRIQTDK